MYLQINKSLVLFLLLIILFFSCKSSQTKPHLNIKYPCNIIANVIGGCEPCLARQSQFDFYNKDTPTYLIYNTGDTDIIKYYSKEIIKQNLPVINDTAFCDSLLKITHQQSCLFKFKAPNRIDTVINMKVYSGCPRKLD